MIKEIAVLSIFISFFAITTPIYAVDPPFIYTNNNFIRKVVVDDNMLYAATTGGILIFNIKEDNKGELVEHLNTLTGLEINNITGIAVNDNGIFFRNDYYANYRYYGSYIDGKISQTYETDYNTDLADYRGNQAMDEFIIGEYENLTDFPIPENGWNEDEWYVDKDGTIWYISGIYLMEYNGSNPPRPFTPPFYDIRSESAIPYNRILKDKKGYLWLPTIGSYIYRFDPAYKDLCDNKEMRELAWEEYPEDRIDDIMQNIYEADIDKNNGSVWFAGYYGVFRHSGEETSKHLEFFNEAKGIPSYRIRAIAIDNNSTVWIGSFGGLVRYKEGDAKEWKRFTSFTNRGRENNLTNYYILDLFADDKNRIWVGTQDGIYVTDDDGENFAQIISNHSIQNSTVNSITIDKNDGIWGSTFSSGIFHIKADGSLDTFDKSDIPPTIPSNFVNKISIDDNNVIWIGTDQGLVKHYNNKWEKFDDEGLWTSNEEGWNSVSSETKLPGRQVDEIKVTGNGDLYCGISPGRASFGGIVKIDSNNSITEYPRISYSFNYIVDDLDFNQDPVDNSDRLWVASYVNGLYCFENNNWEMKSIPGGYRTESITSIVTPKEGDLPSDTLFEKSIWFGTYDNGIFILHEDQNNKIWMNLNEDGLSENVNNTGWENVSYDIALLDNYVLSLYISDNKVWIGYAYDGASVWNLERFSEYESLTNYTLEDGLADETVYSIAVDNQERVWFATYGGLSVLEQK